MVRWTIVLCSVLVLGSVEAMAQKAESPYWFQDADDRATVYFLSSDDVPAGGLLAIYGDDLHSSGQVTLGGAAAGVVEWSGRRVVVTVPAGASGPVVVSPAGGSASTPFPVTVTSHDVFHLDGAAPSGGNGSPGAPWNSFLTANSTVSPGDQVIVHAGTYTGSGEAVWKANRGGNASNSVTWIANPGDFVFVDGSTADKQAIRIDAPYVNVVGFVTHGSKYQNIHLNGTGSRAIDCEAKNGDGTVSTKGQGINMNAAGTAALGNYVHDNFSHGFYIHADDMRVGYNYVANSGCCGAPTSGGYGIQVYLNVGSTYRNAKIYRNYVTTSNRSGMVIGKNAADSDVYENIVTGNDERCIIVNYAATNTTIRNNVCFANDSNGAGFYEIDLYNGVDATIHNNAMIGGSYAVSKRSGMSGTVGVDSNLYHAVSRWTWDGTNYSSLSAWRSATGQDGQSQFVAPGFVNTSGDDFRPAAGSPLIDAGDNARCAHPVLGPQCDIGAFEYDAGGTPVTEPPTPQNLRRTDKR